jgi:cholesterol transport system auxiliary component
MILTPKKSAINFIAVNARSYCGMPLFCIIFTAVVLGGCSALPDKPQRATLFDFGPGPLTQQATTRQTPLPAVAVDDVTTAGGVLDNSAVLYRLGYQDEQELRPYSLARWSMPPAQLVRQRLRERLSVSRPVYNARESLALNRSQSAGLPPLVRLELLEFSHFFSAPNSSVGLVKLRATLVEVTPSGEKLIDQRAIVVQRPAPSADAQGGVRALTLATDAAIAEIEQWLQANSNR